MAYNWQPASPVNRDLTLQWGLVMDGQAHPQQEFANTLAHELGHFFGLRHRRGNGPDNVVWPQWENLMDGSSPTPDCEDLDVLQATVVRFSEIMFRTSAIDTSPEVEPSDHRGVGTLGGAILGGIAGAIIGAVIGAVAGAIIGFVASGGNPAAAASGAAAGAVAGAVAGAIAGAIIGGILGSPSPDP
jgi:hypothetical protein